MAKLDSFFFLLCFAAVLRVLSFRAFSPSFFFNAVGASISESEQTNRFSISGCESLFDVHGGKRSIVRQHVQQGEKEIIRQAVFKD